MNSHWSKCINLAGRPAGLRFECKDCNFVIPYSAPTTITHCGKTEHFEKKWWQTLPVYDMRANWPRDLLWDGRPRVLHADGFGDKIVIEV